MRQIGQITNLPKPSPASRSITPALPAKRPTIDRFCDAELPRLICWRPDIGPTEVRRELTATERSALEAREAALISALRPFEAFDRRKINAALAAMFSGKRMRDQGQNVADIIEITLAVLREFPAWIIDEACITIARHPDHWPPSDGEIYDVCADIARPWQQKLDSAQQLLTAKIADPPRPRPTKEEIEAKLGRPIGVKPDPVPKERREALMADLDERKRRNEERQQPSPDREATCAD